MKKEKNRFPKSKLAWLWENMEGSRAIYILAMALTVCYNVLQQIQPKFFKPT